MECFLCGGECESMSHVFGSVQHMRRRSLCEL